MVSIVVFWAGYQRFRGRCRLHLQGKMWFLKICKATVHQKPGNNGSNCHRRDSPDRVTSPWGWRRYFPPERWPPAGSHGFTTHKTTVDLRRILVTELSFGFYRSDITSTLHETKIELRPVDFLESALSCIKLARGIKLLCHTKKEKSFTLHSVIAVVRLGLQHYICNYNCIELIQMPVTCIFGPKRDEVTGEWRKLHSGDLHNLYSSPDVIRQIKSWEWGGRGMWNAWERGETCRGFWCESPKGKDHLKDQGIVGRMG
jgi:hypothetical protein